MRLAGYGCQVSDRPLAIRLVDHDLGPTQPHLIEEWKQIYGRDPKIDPPLWKDGRKNLMVKGHILEIEDVGEQLGEITSKRCFFMVSLWRWRGGDGCIVCVLAITDPDDDFHFKSGK